MTLDQFIEEQKKILEMFREWWILNHSRDPQNFPMDLRSGDWDEQLKFIQDSEWLKGNWRKN